MKIKKDKVIERLRLWGVNFDPKDNYSVLLKKLKLVYTEVIPAVPAKGIFE